MINSLNDRVTLNNGTKIPGLGLGVFQIPNQDTAEVVANGIKEGYRLIDTAQVYGNEEGTGDNSFKDSYLALEQLYKDGKIKAIGVSNFQIHHLEELAEYATVTPVLDQVESHPKLSQNELRDYAAKHDIKIQAWSPLMQGKILKNATLQTIADKYNKSVAQVVLRWDIQRDVLLAVKSVHPERMQSNADVFDFALEQSDMDKINEMNEDLRVGPNPDEFDF
ncbi:aldo keto reductase [Companilactobacillus mindensis DSM 14500]|uniref:Aldo keto reductase n=1 Tax=Companilactobacillus mindensis DSM 14500 TaxID=1423770 RepID=A0A0R1QFV6_9LACO|nr:aldo/keto reductase [Companilactobacillus mindensis]KRL43712.1 aldo keto reductase [Companilactobacillus mindensis DSM 14500]GEO77907.1 glyoxal reductase [Companilactobacillus mindensis]